MKRTLKEARTTSYKWKRPMFACDFETSTYEGQEYTEVWSAAYAKIGDPTDDVTIQTSIGDFFDAFLPAPINGKFSTFTT